MRDVLLRDVEILHVGEQGWGVKVGLLNPVGEVDRHLTSIVNSNVTVESCHFDGLAGTLEMLLVLNTEHVRVIDTTFRNSSAGNGLGVYQWTRDVSVSGCRFESIRWGIYISTSCNDTLITDSSFVGGDNGIKGAMQSDNDCSNLLEGSPMQPTYPWCSQNLGQYATVFGVPRSHNITIEGCSFRNESIGIALGAVADVSIRRSTFAHNRILGIALGRGCVSPRPTDLLGIPTR